MANSAVWFSPEEVLVFKLRILRITSSSSDIAAGKAYTSLRQNCIAKTFPSAISLNQKVQMTSRLKVAAEKNLEARY